MKSLLRTRLLLAYAGLILAGFTVLALLAGRQILTGTVQDYASGLAEQARLVARALKEPVEEGGEHGVDQAALRSILQTYAGQVGADVVLLDRNGRFLASSNSDNTNSTVINAALSGNISSDTQDDVAYAAAPILEDGRVIGVIQLAAPLSAAKAWSGSAGWSWAGRCWR
jgi:hypothetical protein